MIISRRSRPLVAVAGLASAVALLAGCSHDPGTEDSPSFAEGCEDYPGSMVTADVPDGPTISVPQLEGWDRDEAVQTDTMPIALRQTSEATDVVAPSLTVTVNASQGTAEEARDLEEQALEKQYGLEMPTAEEGTVCGFDAYTLEYEGTANDGVPPHPIMSQIVVVPGSDGKPQHTVVLTAQTVSVDSDTFNQDRATMLDKVQISIPG